MRLVPAIYLEPDDPPASPAEIDMARLVVSDAALAVLRKTGRIATIAPTVVRTGPKLPDVPMAASDATYASSQSAQIFRTVADTFPEADTDVALCFVRGIESDASGLGASRAGYLADGSPGIGLLGWANMVAALGDTRSPSRRLEYGCVVVRALHEMGHVLGLSHPQGSSAEQTQDISTVMGYAPGVSAEGTTRDGRPANPMLFTPAEWAVVEAHPLFRDAPREWTPAEGMVGLYGSDLLPIIQGTVPAAHALVLGRFVEDYR